MLLSSARWKRFFRSYYSLLPLVAILILVAYFLHRYVEREYEDFVQMHTTFAEQSIAGAAELIEQLLRENERRVDLFAQEAKANIQMVMKYGEEEEGFVNDLKLKARRHFPNYFALSIADSKGTIILEDFDNLVGELCQDDIYRFAQSETSLFPAEEFSLNRPIYIHPHAQGYHFDLMSRWDDPATQKDGIFFLSFSTDIIENILAKSHLPRHELILIHRDIDYLIEITAEGTREDLFEKRNEKVTLSGDETDRMLGTPHLIEGTLWLLVDIHDQDLFTEYKQKLYQDVGIIFLYFLVAGGIMYFFVRREEKRKRRAQAELVDANERLEERVAKRTQALEASKAKLLRTNKKLDKEVNSRRAIAESLKSQAKFLKKAKLEAEEANVGKSRILSAASHDLRQPLHTLELLTAGLSQQPNEPETLQKGLKCVRETIVDMERLLDTLLNMGKLEANALTPEIKTFPVQDLLNSSQRTFEAHALESGLGFKVRPCDYYIKSDPVLLERIIHNFIGNAIRYTEEGRILLACRRRGKTLRIEVWDTGVGIPEEMQSKIFDAYVQLKSDPQSRIKGSGLGLSITHRMAELMEHSLDVCSQVGKGSVFYVVVPLVFDAEHLPQTPNKYLASSISAVNTAENLETPCSPERPSPSRLLLIDDDESVLDSSSFLLESNGYEVITAQTAEEASQQLRDSQPQLIICDYHLGNIKGVELIQRLRAQAGKHLPAILLSGDIVPASEDYQVLKKPVPADELCRIIEQELNA